MIKQILFLISIFSLTVNARDWKKIKIPNAICGDGSSYFIFADIKPNTKKLLVEFMGGGACWSYESCFTDKKTWVHPIPELPSFSYLTNDTSTHPFTEDSALYFPYCTGDVFSAHHQAQYQDKKAYHVGYENVFKSLDYLKTQYTSVFNDIERLTLFGSSAGAIGALVHLKTFDLYFNDQVKKYAIIDSPGLHFGPTFWLKFPQQMKTDFTQTFNSVGLYFKENDGFLAQYLAPVFQNYSNWKIGVLQSTRDKTMSVAFGDISQDDHRLLVLSDKGLPAVAKPYGNIKTWISESEKHIFLMWTVSAELNRDIKGKTAAQFVRELMK